MKVVSNTSPLTNLAAIGLFHLLGNLYGHIFIADGVWEELNAYNQAWPDSQDVAAASWAQIWRCLMSVTAVMLRNDSVYRLQAF